VAASAARFGETSLNGDQTLLDQSECSTSESMPTILRGLGELRVEAEAVLRARETSGPVRDTGQKARDRDRGNAPSGGALSAAEAGVALGGGSGSSGSHEGVFGTCSGGDGGRWRRPSEEVERRREQVEQSARELANRERDLATREQRLAEREADVHVSLRAREQQLAAREQKLSEREETWRSQQVAERQELSERQAELADRWRELSDRQEQWRTQQMAEREELEARSVELDQAAAQIREDELRSSARIKEQEDRLRELQRQLNERDMRWAEACKDAHIVKQHLPKRRFSPRGGKENHELQRQLEEQQLRMHEIKRKACSWEQSNDSGASVADNTLGDGSFDNADSSGCHEAFEEGSPSMAAVAAAAVASS